MAFLQRAVQPLEDSLTRFARTSYMSSKNFHYFCGPFSGAACALCTLFGLVAAHQLPPLKPSATPEQMVAFWTEHEVGTKWASALLMFAGLFYLPFTATISSQMRRIPDLPYLASALQLVSGAACILGFVTPAIFLALIPYRLERDAQLTQMFTDIFFFSFFMPWPQFVVQDITFAYGILFDKRSEPLIPKYMALINITIAILYIPATAMHTAKTGPLAWSGGLIFWLIGMLFFLQLGVDSTCLFLAIRRSDTGEMYLKSNEDSLSEGSKTMVTGVEHV